MLVYVTITRARLASRGAVRFGIEPAVLDPVTMAKVNMPVLEVSGHASG